MLAVAARAGAHGTAAAFGCVYSSDMGGLSPRVPLLWIEAIPPPGDYFQGFSLKLPSGGLAWPSLLTQGKQRGLENTVLFRGPLLRSAPPLTKRSVQSGAIPWFLLRGDRLLSS